MLFSGEKKYWYVIWCFNGKERKVVDAISARFKDDKLKPFLPQKDKWFIGRGKKVKEKELLFPGYVFVETTLSGAELSSLTMDFISKSSDMIRMLCSGDSGARTATPIKDEEREAWLYLLGKEKCVETSVGFIEGEKVFIEYGPLKGCEGIIKKINRHKMEATIEAGFMGRTVSISVAVQIIKKTADL